MWLNAIRRLLGVKVGQTSLHARALPRLRVCQIVLEQLEDRVTPSTLITLISFDGTNEAYPYAGPVMDSNGDLFGETEQGGAYNYGTVFELTPTSGGYTLNTLAEFDKSDGYQPVSGLVLDSQGDLFGTTVFGGTNNDGTVFELTPGSSGYTLHTLVYFDDTDGATPNGLVLDSHGDLFGTTSNGGAGAYGTVFELTPGSSGYTLNTLFNFNVADGGLGPSGDLVMDSQGDLFGTISGFGNFGNGYGAVFELSPGGNGYTLHTLANFNGADGTNPTAGVVLDSQGDLFGTTEEGGVNGDGTVFELTPGSSGYTLNTLVNFDDTNGELPTAGLVMDSNGDLFGATRWDDPNSDGTVFELTPESGGYTLNTLVSFDGTDGASPAGNPILDSNGDLLGTTLDGAEGYGTVFELLATPAVSAISPAAGPTTGGTTVTITGTGLADATAVDFGTTPGAIVSDSPTQIVATSPAGTAGTVDVTVETPGGTSATSSADLFTYLNNGPSTFVVTDTGDNSQLSPGDNPTDTNGGVSLRSAISAADFDAAYGISDTITFSPALDGDTLTQGPLDLKQA